MAAGFPEDFLWGVATAAYQIEGADLEEGKGPSIWSDCSHKPGRIDFGESGDVACDHYQRFTEDIDLMTALELNSYRFSISWPRILPKGRGPTNQKNIDFHDRLVDELLEREIQHFVTLYHGGFPLDLQARFGGWECRDVSHYFDDYSSLMFYRLGDRVKCWITLNEPCCSSHVSYLWGEHAPGKRDLKLSLSVSNNLLLSQGEAVKRFRESVKDGLIGLGECFRFC